MTNEEKIKKIKNIIDDAKESKAEPPYLMDCCDRYSEAINKIIEVLNIK